MYFLKSNKNKRKLVQTDPLEKTNSENNYLRLVAAVY